MNSHTPSKGESPSLSLLGRHDEICLRFENVWKAGQKPQIEGYLVEVPEKEQPLLLVKLLRLELAYRCQAGEVPFIGEYQQRFPNYVEAVREAFPGEATKISNRPGDTSSSSPAGAPGPTPAVAGEADLPVSFGRYRVILRLGAGGFGTVYKGHDEELRRDVAIKVPHWHRISRPEDIETFLNEARVLASLDHPHIVPVHDVGRTEDGLCFVVSKYIEGTDLNNRIKMARPIPAESAGLVAIIAEALHYAHRKGLVHRDVKPGNILLDRSDQPFLADFGLALREEDFGKGAQYAGTPAYMSPEQARGEGHRVDGRSDIFSLGVVFYELLTGRGPFRAKSPQELLEQITSVEVRPPRQADDEIPKELERICLKALAKRASDRYTTARDLSDDLRHWLNQARVPVPGALPSSGDGTPGSTTPSTLPTPPDPEKPIKIVPKGLRSFDAHDADFFLELLPGPRDRDGLPDSIRFWKTRVEETDPDNTFRVGLIYGPSGCGKSSLVKAGLLPRLSDKVIAVYVEATANETEIRLLNRLRKKCPDLPGDLGLIDVIAILRRGRRSHAKKILIILDQFEQWLQAKKEENCSQLVQALRQCDGGGVQCVAMVRDDFWMASTRFMGDLEIPLVEGQNSTPVDLFDKDHARKVLFAFGRAFGKLPEMSNEITKDQKQFLDLAVSSLAQEGRVVSVRLAMFAEMIKGEPWTPTKLKEKGGAEGIGVAFLEETFCASKAPPLHRYHQKAASAVLKSLLPETSSNLKCSMRSYNELLKASGYRNGLDFDRLINILDKEVRLITLTDPEGNETNTDSVLQDGNGQKYYQLTHDYLVHSIREWLTRKEKETRQGRAELLLTERTSLWVKKPEVKYLPNTLDWLTIRLFTNKKNWTDAQKKMMRLGYENFCLAILFLVGSTSFCLMALIIVFQSIISPEFYYEKFSSKPTIRYPSIDKFQEFLGISKLYLFIFGIGCLCGFLFLFAASMVRSISEFLRRWTGNHISR